MTKTKGRRQKPVPQRTCIICRQTQTKRALVRIVRTSDDGVQIDPTGKLAGRGAYLCRTRTCWNTALNNSRLSAALKTTLTPDELVALRAFAASLPEIPDAAPEAPAQASNGISPG
jgi:uncharacterized protein